MIAAQTERNRTALLHLIDRAACPYADLGGGYAAANCGPLFDDLEINRGWVRNAAGTDTATSGRWAVGNPQPTSSGGAKQLGKTVSGIRALVTGAAAGSSAGANDVDGGTTTIRSRAIRLPGGPGGVRQPHVPLGLRPQRRTRRPTTRSGSSWRPRTGRQTVVFEVLGRPVNVNGSWRTARVPLEAWAGQAIHLVVEATDGGERQPRRGRGRRHPHPQALTPAPDATGPPAGHVAGNPAAATGRPPAPGAFAGGAGRDRLRAVATRPIRVLLVDDHPAILDAVGAAVRAAPDLALAGDARTLDEARAALAGGADRVDVVVSDVQLAGEAEGLRLLDGIPADGPAVLLLSSFDQPPLIRSAFERGAAGYLIKTSEVGEILDAIRTVASGGTAFSAAMLRAIRSAPRRPSDREMEVLALLCGGASNDEIGVRLGVTEKTVESHLRRLFDRYGVLSRTELAVLALREGWVAEKGRA